MQLKLKIFALFFVVSFGAFAQDDPSDSTKIDLKNIEVSFIGSYYEQDGNHSPVTGGIGTEQLDNVAPSIVVVVPIDTVREVSFNGGIDVYSSASSDNINNPYVLPNHVSSASARDTRGYGTCLLYTSPSPRDS